jgi:hypothetical protein
MSGQIFISYRREDDQNAAGRLYDRLLARFPKEQIFFDVDNIEPGVHFLDAIEASVGSCDVLIAVIGKRWLVSSDKAGKRRLEKPEDFVRVEIGAALKRNIRVIPVLLDGATMPAERELPDDLKSLVWRQALEVSHNRFNADFGRLLAALEKFLEKADAERKQREEKDRVEANRRRRESQIIAALEDKRFKWRTVQKISHQLKVPETEVLTQLKELIGKDVVIQSTIPDKDGNDLFATRKHLEQRG